MSQPPASKGDDRSSGARRGGGPGAGQRGSDRRGGDRRGRDERSSAGGRAAPQDGGTSSAGPLAGVPGAAREPIGRDRAGTGARPPRRRTTTDPTPPRPDLPWDDEPVLPRGVRKEIDRVLGPGPRARDVALALSVGAAAIDEGFVDAAVEALAWAKHSAPRVASIREAYGVGLYLAERYGDALTELQAYRRMTGHNDQNHLIADSLRALDRGLDRVATVARELVDDDRAPADRRAEATLVWAGATADAGEVRTARVLVRRALELAGRDDAAEHVLRLRLFAAELAGRDDDASDRDAQLRAIAAADPEFYAALELEGPADDGTNAPTRGVSASPRHDV
jgi:hypothetical protein